MITDMLARRLRRAVYVADRARDSGDWDRAAKFYRKALKRNPQTAPIWVQYGHALKESGRLIEAEEAYRKAIEIDPEPADPYLQLGHVLKLKGQLPQAITAYRTALKQDPEAGEAAGESSALTKSDLRKTIEESGWFSSDWYRSRYPHVEAAGIDPLDHYVRSGARQGHAPGPVFDPATLVRYIVDDADVVQAQELRERLEREMIVHSGLFDLEWYRAAYPDVAAAGMDSADHYVRYGWSEGRVAGPKFDAEDYTARYSDVGHSNPLLHYILIGLPEGRYACSTARSVERRLVFGSGLFDGDWYCTTYPDVTATHHDPLDHYLDLGESAGRSPSPLFDAVDYRARYANALGETGPLLHFLSQPPGSEFEARSLNRHAEIDPFYTEPLRLSATPMPVPSVCVMVRVRRLSSFDEFCGRLKNIPASSSLYILINCSDWERQVWRSLRAARINLRSFVSVILTEEITLAALAVRYEEIVQQHEVIVYTDDQDCWCSSSYLVTSLLRAFECNRNLGLLYREDAGWLDRDSSVFCSDHTSTYELTTENTTSRPPVPVRSLMPHTATFWVRCSAIARVCQASDKDTHREVSRERFASHGLRHGYRACTYHVTDGRLRHIGRPANRHQLAREEPV